MSLQRLTIFAGSLALLTVQTGLAWQTSEKDKTPPAFTGNPTGRPKAFKTGEMTACAIWHDGEWWNIHTTGKKGTKGPTATHRWGGSVKIEGDTFVGKFDKLEGSKKAINADWIVPYADGSGFEFQFINRGHRDELKFKAGDKATTITIKIIENNKGDVKKILIGRKGENPEKVTFTVPAHPGKK